MIRKVAEMVPGIAPVSFLPRSAREAVYLVSLGCPSSFRRTQVSTVSTDQGLILNPSTTAGTVRDEPARDWSTAAEIAQSGSRWPLALAIGMLFLGALPDGLIAPLLNDLFVQRYGASVGAAHWFMAVNLIGAIAVVPILSRLRRSLPPSVLLAGAAVVNGLLLALMALPIGFAATIVLRIFEGAADLAMLAIIFDLLGKAGRDSNRGARFGAAGTVLLFGLAIGVVAGGFIGNSTPILAFVAGACACLVIAAVAIARHSAFDGLVRSCPVVGDLGTITPKPKPLWPTLVMVGSDRAIAGVTATTVIFYFAQVLDLSPAWRGGLLGVALLLVAIGAWPAGLLADRVGHLRLRWISGLFYAGSLVMIPLAGSFGMPMLIIALGIFGLSGAALMPTSLTLACESGKGSVAMGAYHACGNVGYHLFGVGLAAMLLTFIGGAEPATWVYHVILIGFAAAHLALGTVSCLVLKRRLR
ncbi:MAG: MFS transporter [Phycisphaerales bacterium]|nr:MAG: MFS transporter [Phycisphaerales bacterium]